MSNKTQLIETRFTELITKGEQVLQTRRPPPRNVVGDDRVDGTAAEEWRTSAGQLLSSLFGRESEYYQRFCNAYKVSGFYTDLARGLAVVKAAYSDLQKGYLIEVKTLVRAEIFDDILEQADHLHSSGYYQAAAVLAGAILEDSLRKLCERSGIALTNKPKLDWMNAELAKNGVYNTLVLKRVTLLADIRNKAAHGKWSEFSSSDVETMLSQVRNFVTDQL